MEAGFCHCEKKYSVFHNFFHHVDRNVIISFFLFNQVKRLIEGGNKIVENTNVRNA